MLFDYFLSGKGFSNWVWSTLVCLLGVVYTCFLITVLILAVVLVRVQVSSHPGSCSG